MATSIGTAWIQIKPTTKGLQNAIKKDITPAATTAGQNAGKSFSTGFAAKIGAVAGVTQSIFSKLSSVVASSFSSAIGRTDTLNNFSNVMGNLNINADSADAAIQKMSDGLSGLPTSLDDAAGAVQRFTTKNMDVEKSTDMFLALNNALLAGGASAEVQSTALEQISQAYAKGKPDMIEWRSLLTAMPAQVAQLGQAFGMSSEELGEALRKGDISMDEFMAKVVELNEKGTEGFKSFAEQAVASTDTLQTRIANVRTSITKVIAAALNGDELDKPISQLADRVVEIAPQLIEGFSRAVIGLAQAIPQLIPPLLEAIIAVAPSLFEGIVQLTLGIVNMLPQLVPILASAIPTLVIGIISTLTSPETLTSLFKAAYDLLYQLVLAVPEIVIALSEALPDLIVSLVDFLTNPENIAMIIGAAVTLFMAIVKAVPRIIGALLEAFGTLFARLWDTLTTNFGRFAASFGEFLGGVFKGAINGVLAFIENFINSPIRLINGFISLINKAFGFIGVNLGSIALISLPRLATGGIVEGIGTSTSDSNIYALSKGEYVIRAAAAQNIGYENLDRMNETGEVDSAGEARNNISIIINGYNRSPDELANIISRKIALKTQGVLA